MSNIEHKGCLGCGLDGILATGAFIFLVALTLSARESAVGINWAIKIHGNGIAGAVAFGGEKYTQKIHFPYGLEESRQSLQLYLESFDGSLFIGRNRDLPNFAFNNSYIDKLTP